MSRPARNYSAIEVARERATVGAASPSLAYAAPYALGAGAGLAAGVVVGVLFAASRPIVLLFGAAGAILGVKLASDIESKGGLT